MNAFAGIRPKGGQRGVKTRPPSFFPWRLQWGLSVFQWGSNPHNRPANFYPEAEPIPQLSPTDLSVIVGWYQGCRGD